MEEKKKKAEPPKAVAKKEKEGNLSASEPPPKAEAKKAAVAKPKQNGAQAAKKTKKKVEDTAPPATSEALQSYFSGFTEISQFLDTAMKRMLGSKDLIINSFQSLETRVTELETKLTTHQTTIKDLRAENVVLTANVKIFEDQNIHLSKENAELRADNYKLTKVANLHKEICTKLETAAKQNKELTSKVAELQAEKEQETNRLMQEIERIVEEKSKLVEENLRFLGSNLDDIPLEELRSLELEIRGIHQNIQRAKDKREAEETLCVVCLEKPKVMAFAGCGHRCVCEVCAVPLKECPMCRKPGVPIKIFF